MDEPWVSMKREDDWSVDGENAIEILIAQSMRMFFLWLERHQIHDVDDANFQSGRELSQYLYRCERLQCWHIPGACHDDVGLFMVIVAREVPDTDPRCAVFDSVLHGEPLQCRLFSGNDDIDVVAATKAVVGDGEEGICIRWQIDADDFGLLVYDVINESWILVGKAIVVLLPDVRCEEDVERRNGPSPWDLARDLQPFGMLIEHRVYDVDECLVAGEESVTSSE